MNHVLHLAQTVSSAFLFRSKYNVWAFARLPLRLCLRGRFLFPYLVCCAFRPISCFRALVAL